MIGNFETFTVYRTGDLSDTHDENQAPISAEVPSFWGVVFPDGTCTLRWAGVVAATSVWASWDDAMKVHGHFEPRYGTRLEWNTPQVVGVKALCPHCNEYTDFDLSNPEGATVYRTALDIRRGLVVELYEITVAILIWRYRKLRGRAGLVATAVRVIRRRFVA